LSNKLFGKIEIMSFGIVETRKLYCFL